MTAVGEIIGESSRVLLRLLTSDKPDNYATVAAVTRPLNFMTKSASCRGLGRNAWWAGFWPMGPVLDTPVIY